MVQQLADITFYIFILFFIVTPLVLAYRLVNRDREGELLTLLLMSMLLGVPGSAMVDFGVCIPKVLGVPMVVGVPRTAAMSARLQS